MTVTEFEENEDQDRNKRLGGHLNMKLLPNIWTAIEEGIFREKNLWVLTFNTISDLCPFIIRPINATGFFYFILIGVLTIDQ